MMARDTKRTSPHLLERHFVVGEGKLRIGREALYQSGESLKL
jgi:hypothetical protein